MCHENSSSISCLRENSVCEVHLRSSFIPEISILNITICKNSSKNGTNTNGDLWIPVGTVYSEKILAAGSTFEIRFYPNSGNILDASTPILRAKMLYNGDVTSTSINCGQLSWMNQDSLTLGELVVEDQTMRETRTVIFRLPLKRPIPKDSSVHNLWTVHSLYDLATLYGHFRTLQQWKQFAVHLGFVKQEIDELENALQQTSLSEPASPITPKRAFCLLYHCFQRQGGTPSQFIRNLRKVNQKHRFICPDHSPSLSGLRWKESIGASTKPDNSPNVLSGVKEVQLTCGIGTSPKQSDSICHNTEQNRGIYESLEDQANSSVGKSANTEKLQSALPATPNIEQRHRSIKKSWLKEARRCRKISAFNDSDFPISSNSQMSKPELATPVKRITADWSPVTSEEFPPAPPSAKKARTNEPVSEARQSIAMANKTDASTAKGSKLRTKRKRNRCMDALKSTKQFLLPDLWHPHIVENASPSSLLSTVRTKLEETRQQTAEFHRKLDDLMKNMDRKADCDRAPNRENLGLSAVPEGPFAQNALNDATLWRLASLFEHAQAPTWKRLITLCGLNLDELTRQISRTAGHDSRIAVYLVLLCWLEKHSNPYAESLPTLNSLFNLLKSDGCDNFVSYCTNHIKYRKPW